jgi:ribosomal protein S6
MSSSQSTIDNFTAIYIYITKIYYYICKSESTYIPIFTNLTKTKIQNAITKLEESFTLQWNIIRHKVVKQLPLKNQATQSLSKKIQLSDENS